MRRFRTFIIPLAILATSIAPHPVNAQTVFFDDFDGNALLPHWNQPPASYWAYNVGNGMLNVTGLFSPSHPKSPINTALMSAPFAAQSDFQMDVWMGWDGGSQPHRLELEVLGPFGANPIIASMGLKFEEGDPVPLVYAATTNQAIFVPAPPPGIHHFTISRMASQFNFSFNGVPFASFPDIWAIPAANVGFRFMAPFPGPQTTFHIDRVVVVPAPRTLLVVVLGVLSNRHRVLRRR